MATSITFWAGQNSIQELAGMGLGFYGPGNFGSSVRVGLYQDNTYITDGTGAAQGAKANNVKYIDGQHGQLGTGDTHALRDIPNYLAPLNVRFNSDVPCQVQNATMTTFDRVNVNNPPVGAVIKVAEIVHPLTSMNPGAPTGSGSASWYTPGGSGGPINGYTWDPPVHFTGSPGTSGFNAASGISVADTQHDWYAAISASPSSIGSKTSLALLFSLEYL